jgi:hypothetical protein
MFSIYCVILRICCSRWISDCYFYSLKNRLIDMTMFLIFVIIPTNTIRSELFTGPHLASWGNAAAGPLVQIDICGIVSIYVM